MFGKRPYFMKNKKWYCKTKLAGADTFNLTKLGMRDPDVLKSYLEYYNIKKEDVFEYANDYNTDTEFKMWASETIRKKMKEKGEDDSEIEKEIDLFLNIDEIRAADKD